MIEWVFELVMAPISWAVTTTLVFAATAPLNHVYIVMGVSGFLALAIIYSMLPKKHKVAQSVEVSKSYEITEEDEREARKILTEARTI